MTEYYQAFGCVFGVCCYLLGIWHGIRPAPIEPTGFDLVKYHVREKETVLVEEKELVNEYNFEL
jgi:hypothetical protein